MCIRDSYKRIRFANKSEQFSAEQRELFEESWSTDASAQAAEAEQLSPASKPARPTSNVVQMRSGRRSAAASSPANQRKGRRKRTLLRACVLPGRPRFRRADHVDVGPAGVATMPHIVP